MSPLLVVVSFYLYGIKQRFGHKWGTPNPYTDNAGEKTNDNP